MEQHFKKEGTWLTYRSDVKVLDCSIRDGGLINNYHFDDEFVKGVYDTCIQISVDYMEIGKICSKKVMSPDEYGAWNFCEEEDLRRIVGDNQSPLKLAVMADIGRTFKENIIPKQNSVIDMVRVATYIHQIPSALELIEDAHNKGYETTVNLMAISKVSESNLDEALGILAKSSVDVIYIVDTFGTFYSEEIRNLVSKYQEIINNTGKKLGIHAHNNQQLAYANTLEAMMMGTSFLDATISGLGRGAGNCPLELLMGFLKNPKYQLVPLLDFIEKFIVPLRKQIHWGYEIPYMLTGQLNEHPRAAISFMDTHVDKGYVKFYNSLLDSQD